MRMLDTKVGTSALEGTAAEQYLFGAHRPDRVRRPDVAGRFGEVGAVVGEHDVDPIGNGGGKGVQLVLVPVDYSENVWVLVRELTDHGRNLQKS